MPHSHAFALRPHDRIVFLGDSITEQHLYTNYVESYLASRFPELKLTFFNAGWGGDTSPGGVARLERDVLALHPTVVTICYGMNDGSYCPPTDAIRERYVSGMQDIIGHLKAHDVRIVLLTPGYVDETANPNLGKVEYNRRGLRILADEVLKLAAVEQLPVFDLLALMLAVDAKAKAAEPKWCMAPDGVHPDPAGHLVMAYGLLQALNVPPRRQFVTVDATTGKVSASKGLQLGKLHRSAHGITLDVRLDRLPFFVEMGARKVLPYLPFMETYNELKFTVTGLARERAYLRTSTWRSPTTPRAELEAGFNLFAQWGFGAQAQAELVHRYTAEKDQVYYKIWRLLTLNGMKDGYHHAKPHSVGVRFSPLLDRGRDALVSGRAALTCKLNLVSTDLPGEPLQDLDFISHWSLLGPCPLPYRQDRLGGEAAFTAQVPTVSSAWQAGALNLATPGNNLNEAFGNQVNCFAYLLTTLVSDKEQDAELLVGSDDGVAVFFNGAQVLDHLDVGRGLIVDQEVIPVRLRAGRNVLLLKVSQGGGQWGVCARFRGLRAPITALLANEG